ncbi:MAG TPA: GGDEF domain-containing protein [Terriglobales bacterium]|nr:GGDEF domain-containing protein [Terriglobales bacterium]
MSELFTTTYDSLTNIFDRETILDILRREVNRRERMKNPLGIIMLDLDGFKKVNDTYGNLVGDVVLKETARRLSLAVRSYDSVGRYDGGKFLAVIPGCDFPNLIVGAERLRHCIADRPIETNPGSVKVTLSVGLASAMGGEPCDTASLIHLADGALNKAKMGGRNRVEITSVYVAAGAAR